MAFFIVWLIHGSVAPLSQSCDEEELRQVYAIAGLLTCCWPEAGRVTGRAKDKTSSKGTPFVTYFLQVLSAS